MGEGQGWWIREPCPARAQAAGGNASGKPPYRCFNLEDALATACSRCTWPERMLWILTACLDFLKIHTRVKNNAWLDCSEHSDLNTLFESEMNPRKTKALTDSTEETSSLNTSCFDYNCLRRTFCFHHWSTEERSLRRKWSRLCPFLQRAVVLKDQPGLSSRWTPRYL